MISETATRRVDSSSMAHDDHASLQFSRWAGWSGIGATIAFIVTVVMTTGGVAGPDGPGDMTRFAADVSDGGWLGYLYGVAGVVLVVLYMPMAVGLHRMLGRSAITLNGSAAVVFGLAVLLPAYLINLLATFTFAPLAAEVGDVGAVALYADYSIARSTAELFFTVGSILSLGVGPLLWGLAWLRSDVGSRWLGWAGVITGVAGAVWFVWLVDNPLFGIALIVNVLMSLVFFAGASVVLLLRGRSRA